MNKQTFDFQFLLFLIIVLSCFFLINLFVYWNLQPLLTGKSYLTMIFILLAIIYPLSRVLNSRGIHAKALLFISSYWLGILVLLFSAYLLLLIFRVPLHFLDGNISSSSTTIRNLIPFLVLLLSLYGYFNATNYKLKELTLQFQKGFHRGQPLRAVLFSDLHLGYLVGLKYLKRITEEIKALKPDLVLIAGDLIDEEIPSEMLEEMAKELSTIPARYGIVVITGNHEYYSRKLDLLATVLDTHGINLLQDSLFKPLPGVTLIGRRDREANRFSDTPRKPLSELLSGIPSENLTILLDHQPFNLDEASLSDVDLQLSGHTHHGQIFPLNLITALVYRKSRGYYRQGKTHYYITSGVGTWGPLLRLGSHPEIVLLTLLPAPEHP